MLRFARRMFFAGLRACVPASVSYRVLIGGDFLTSEDLLAVGDLYRRLVRPELVRERAMPCLRATIHSRAAPRGRLFRWGLAR